MLKKGTSGTRAGRTLFAFRSAHPQLLPVLELLLCLTLFLSFSAAASVAVNAAGDEGAEVSDTDADVSLVYENPSYITVIQDGASFEWRPDRDAAEGTVWSCFYPNGDASTVTALGSGSYLLEIFGGYSSFRSDGRAVSAADPDADGRADPAPVEPDSAEADADGGEEIDIAEEEVPMGSLPAGFGVEPQPSETASTEFGGAAFSVRNLSTTVLILLASAGAVALLALVCAKAVKPGKTAVKRP